MKQIALKTSLSIILVFALIFVFSSQALAESGTLDLVRDTILTNFIDHAGIWQIIGGRVFSDSVHVANYALARRTVTGGGTDPQNTAMLTMTIFALGEDPPQSITLQGSYSYNNGSFTGSVSAASSTFSFLIGATFSGSLATDTLTITW